MFGTNPIRKAENRPDLSVHSIWYTLQGEGPFAGRPAVFIRLAGCNLQCTFCDTEFERGAMRQSVDDIMQRINFVLLFCVDAVHFAEHRPSLVVLTGGEPLRQNVSPLIHALHQGGFDVQIETNGTLWNANFYAEPFERPVYVVVSPKTPKLAPALQQYCAECAQEDDFTPPAGRNVVVSAFKYIVDAGVDQHPEGHWWAGLPTNVMAPPACYPRSRVYLQPCDWRGYTAADAKAIATITTDHNENTRLCRDTCLLHGYNLCLQLHKIVGVD